MTHFTFGNIKTIYERTNKIWEIQPFLLAQNGIWVKFYHFGPKNNDEKCSRIILFEIPPWGKLFVFITGKVFAQNYKFSNKNNILPERRDFKKKKDSWPLFTIIFRPKLVNSDKYSIYHVKVLILATKFCEMAKYQPHCVFRSSVSRRCRFEKFKMVSPHFLRAYLSRLPYNLSYWSVTVVQFAR